MEGVYTEVEAISPMWTGAYSAPATVKEMKSMFAQMLSSKTFVLHHYRKLQTLAEIPVNLGKIKTAMSSRYRMIKRLNNRVRNKAGGNTVNPEGQVIFYCIINSYMADIFHYFKYIILSKILKSYVEETQSRFKMPKNSVIVIVI